MAALLPPVYTLPIDHGGIEIPPAPAHQSLGRQHPWASGETVCIGNSLIHRSRLLIGENIGVTQLPEIVAQCWVL